MQRRGGELIEERLTESIIGAFYEVYNLLGFGLQEHFYVSALERELIARNHQVSREIPVEVWYRECSLAGSDWTWSSTGKSSSKQNQRSSCIPRPHDSASVICVRVALKLDSFSILVRSRM
jgi:hypothetical protein